MPIATLAPSNMPRKLVPALLGARRFVVIPRWRWSSGYCVPDRVVVSNSDHHQLEVPARYHYFECADSANLIVDCRTVFKPTKDERRGSTFGLCRKRFADAFLLFLLCRQCACIRCRLTLAEMRQFLRIRGSEIQRTHSSLTLSHPRPPHHTSTIRSLRSWPLQAGLHQQENTP